MHWLRLKTVQHDLHMTHQPLDSELKHGRLAVTEQTPSQPAKLGG